MSGITLTSPQLLLRCVNKGAERAKMMVTLVKDAIGKDSAARADGRIPNFTEIIRNTTITSLREKPLPIMLKRFKAKGNVESNDIEMKDDFEDSKVEMIAKNTGVLLPETKATPWIVDSSSSDEENDSSDSVQATATQTIAVHNTSEDSEEDVQMIVESNI